MQILLQKKETEETIIIFIVTLSAVIVKWNLRKWSKGTSRSSEGLVVQNAGKDNGMG
jgi:hypothetical protein